MEKPETFDQFKKDESSHKYHYTHGAHENCKAYDQYLKDQFDELKLEEETFNIKVQKVNGNIVRIITSKMTMQNWIDCLKFVNKNQ